MKAQKRTFPNIHFVPMDELKAVYTPNSEAKYVQLYKNEGTIQRWLKNGVTTDFNENGQISYDRLEDLVNLLREEKDVYIYVEDVENTTSAIKIAISRYHSAIHEYKCPRSNLGKTRSEQVKLIYDQFMLMHKRVTDEQYKDVKKWVEERDTFKYMSLTHLVTILDYRAKEQNYIVRGTSSEIRNSFKGKGLLNYQMRTLSLWESDRFELPVISVWQLEKFLNYVKRPVSDVLYPILALN